MVKQFVYSLDNKRYYDIDDVLELIKDEGSDIKMIYKGAKIPYSHSDFICGKEIIESIQNRAYEQLEDYSVNYISHFDNESKTEHKDCYLVIERLISEYLNKVIPQPDFFRVENIEKIPLSDLEKQV